MKPVALSKAIEIIAAIFILLFVYTATNKLLAHQTFVINLEKSPLLGFASSFLSWTVPAVEIAISVLLFVPRFREAGLVSSFCLITVFTIYIAYMLMTSSHLPCSCGGLISKLSWRQHVWLNVSLMALAGASIFLNNRLKFLLQ